jgi:hypothetical protein
MTLLSGGVSAGFSLDRLLGSGSNDSFARYAASRSVALLLAMMPSNACTLAMTIPRKAIATRERTLTHDPTDRQEHYEKRPARCAVMCGSCRESHRSQRIQVKTGLPSDSYQAARAKDKDIFSNTVSPILRNVSKAVHGRPQDALK